MVSYFFGRQAPCDYFNNRAARLKKIQTNSNQFELGFDVANLGVKQVFEIEKLMV